MESAAIGKLGLLLEIGELVIELVCFPACLTANCAHIDIIDLDTIECVPGVLIAAKHDLAEAVEATDIKWDQVGRNCGVKVGAHLWCKNRNACGRRRQSALACG